MKNLFKYITLSLGIALTFTSCEEKLLEIDPRDQLSTDVVFSSLDGAEGAALGLYERGRFIYTSTDACVYKLFYTDILKAGTHIGDQTAMQALGTFQNFDANNTIVSTVWNGYYRGLFLANTMIDGIPTLSVDESNSVDVARKNGVLGEAYFFRAYFHLNLVEYWDNIFLADRVFSEFKNVALADKADVYKLIIEDLNTAIELLPEASDVNSRGRVSKGVARHLLSLAYMDAGSYGLSGIENPFDKAAEMAEAVINDAAYSLLPEADLANVFNIDMEHAESILVWQFYEGAPTGAGQTQWMSCMTTPLYDRVLGVARSFEQGARPWSRVVPSDYYWTLFENDDPRLNAWHKRYWTYDIDDAEDALPDGVSIGDTVTAANIEDVAGLGMNAVIPTTTKYFEDGTRGRVLDDADGMRNIMQFRLAEAYLISAEANMKSGNTALGQQRLDELRDRSGRAPIALTIDNILNEQARELGHEGRRYPMLKRLGVLVDKVKLGSPQIGQNMMAHHVRWPLPLAEVQLLDVDQNTGYE